MVRHGGVLPLAFCNRIGDSAFSLASFLDGSWDQHVAMNKNFRESLPAAKWNSELRGSMPAFELPFISSQIEFTPAAQIQVDILPGFGISAEEQTIFGGEPFSTRVDNGARQRGRKWTNASHHCLRAQQSGSMFASSGHPKTCAPSAARSTATATPSL
ncbi:hypothetical protein Pelo_19499 [Pelomyxa schiedti]|nr:hypothetical protein Pelo_19499 [Pelomyxa schiedti]